MLSNAMYKQKSRHTLTVLDVLYRNNAFSQNMDIFKGKVKYGYAKKAKRLALFINMNILFSNEKCDRLNLFLRTEKSECPNE